MDKRSRRFPIFVRWVVAAAIGLAAVGPVVTAPGAHPGHAGAVTVDVPRPVPVLWP